MTRGVFQMRKVKVVGTMRRSRHFTLTEMLVVVAVMSLLMYMLVPAMKNSMTVAARVQCSQHLSQIGAGYHLYGGDQNEHIVPVWRVNDQGIQAHWSGKLRDDFFYGNQLEQYVGGPKISWLALLTGLGYVGGVSPSMAPVKTVDGIDCGVVPETFTCTEKEGPVSYLTGPGPKWLPHMTANGTFVAKYYYTKVRWPSLGNADPEDDKKWTYDVKDRGPHFYHLMDPSQTFLVMDMSHPRGMMTYAPFDVLTDLSPGPHDEQYGMVMGDGHVEFQEHYLWPNHHDTATHGRKHSYPPAPY